jgi:alkylated DNA repair dioxygenase AlkB
VARRFVTAPADALTIDRRAPARRLQLDATSWVDLVDGFVRQPDRRFRELRQTTEWRQNEVLRYDHYVPERRLGASLDGNGLPLLRQIALHLEATYRVPWTGVGALLYRDGQDFQGFHGDREMRWLDDTLVAIVVLGARRPFALRPRGPITDAIERVPAGSRAGDIMLTPGEGDLLVMGGACQRDWLHSVPAADTTHARISLTWRWTSRRGRPDTNPTYYEGRQYSDRPRRPGTRTHR